jgi:hypothetical protein
MHRNAKPDTAEEAAMPTRRCAYDHDCTRVPPPFHAMCEQHERIVMSSAFGPVSWTERAELGVLPTVIVGGSPRA